jgi:hypothetical protein
MLVSGMPIMIRHGQLQVAGTLCRIQTTSQLSSPLRWSAAKLPLGDFPTPQHQSQQLPQLQIKAVVGMLIMAHRG